MMKTVALVMGLALCDATFVAKIKNANAALLRKVADVDCRECGTDHGKVDIWDPEVHDGSEMRDSWTGDIDVRGGNQLLEVLKDVDFEHIHEDLEAVLSAEKERLSTRIGKVAVNATSTNWFADYHPYNEINDRLTYYSWRYAGVRKFSVGASYENNEIYGIRFGSRRSKNALWIQCGIHAREWIAPATCMYFTEQLLKRQHFDPEVRAILSQTEIYMVPVLNRDGYQFTWTDERLWRKNRQPNEDSEFVGTDLNRNWDSAFGVCGVSTNFSSEVYPGTAPWSAPETRRVRDFLANLEASGKQVLGAHDFHSYSNLLLRSYAWTIDDSPNEAAQKALGAKMVQAILENSGQVYQNIKANELYCGSGIAADWFADHTTQNSGFSFELRGDSFILPPDQIIPTGEEIYAAMIVWFNAVIGISNKA